MGDVRISRGQRRQANSPPCSGGGCVGQPPRPDCADFFDYSVGDDLLQIFLRADCAKRYRSVRFECSFQRTPFFWQRRVGRWSISESGMCENGRSGTNAPRNDSNRRRKNYVGIYVHQIGYGAAPHGTPLLARLVLSPLAVTVNIGKRIQFEEWSSFGPGVSPPRLSPGDRPLLLYFRMRGSMLLPALHGSLHMR